MIENDDATADLLRLAGPRPGVAADRAARVREAVRAEWQRGARRRMSRRRLIAATALLAAAAAALLAIRMTMPRERPAAPPGETVATVERLEGASQRALNDAVRAGEWVETGASGRVALRLTDARSPEGLRHPQAVQPPSMTGWRGASALRGTSLRLDTGSRVRLISGAVVELAAGAVYVDNGRQGRVALRPDGPVLAGRSALSADRPGLEVRTPLGVARDVGTQFEVRLGETSLRVRVRTGLVELQRGDQVTPARAGSELRVTADTVVTHPVAVAGPEWDWATGLAPEFDIEGRTLAAYLDHLCHEQGWTLRYADAALARDASSIILHGSVRGLSAQEALAAVLTTSGLGHRFSESEVLVFRRGK